jgi:hypothetical protein
MLHSFLFWTHVSIVLVAISIGFFLPFYAVLLLVGAHRLHMILFDGCALSRLQRRLGSLSTDYDFLQVAAKKLFGTKLSSKGSIVLDYILISIPISVSAAKVLF